MIAKLMQILGDNNKIFLNAETERMITISVVDGLLFCIQQEQKKEKLPGRVSRREEVSEWVS